MSPNAEFDFVAEIPQAGALPTPPAPVLHKTVRDFVEATNDIMDGYAGLTEYLATLPGDPERLAVCELSLVTCAQHIRRQSSRALRAGIMAALACHTTWLDAAGEALVRNLHHYKRALFTQLNLGLSESQLSRNTRAGVLFLELRKAGLPVRGDSVEPLVWMLPLKAQAVTEWRHLVQACGGKAPAPAEVKEHVRLLRGKPGKGRKIDASEVIQTCEKLLKEMPSGTEKEIQLLGWVEALHAYATNQKKSKKQGKALRKKEKV